MGFSDAISSLGISDATGNVAKALFCVRDVSTSAPEGGGFQTKDGQVVDVSTKQFDKASEAAQKALLRSAKNKLKGGKSFSSATSVSLSDISDTMRDNGYLVLEVQYNPTSLSFSSESGGTRRYYGRPGMGTGGDNQMITRTIPKRTILRFKLIMERINVNNAFLNSSETVGNASAGNVISSVSSAVDRFKGNEETYSVRDYLEGFMGLLATRYTRDVIFFWGQTCFHGELTDVQTHYKMFNRDGDPILGEIDITLTQHEYNEYDNSRWEEAFDNLFDQDDNGATSAVSKMWSGKGIF